MKYSRKGIYNSQNHITLQKVKNIKHLVSPASNLAPKMVVPLASPGRIIVVLFEQNMPFVVKLNPEFSRQLSEEAKAIIALSLFLLAWKKKVLLYRFRRTVNFWLPHVLRAQPPYARGRLNFPWNSLGIPRLAGNSTSHSRQGLVELPYLGDDKLWRSNICSTSRTQCFQVTCDS